MSNQSDYRKYKLYQAGEYVGYVAIHKRFHEFERAIFEKAQGAIFPQMSHYTNVHEVQEDGTYKSRGEGDYLAHFDIEYAQEDVYLITGSNVDGTKNA